MVIPWQLCQTIGQLMHLGQEIMEITLFDLVTLTIDLWPWSPNSSEISSRSIPVLDSMTISRSSVRALTYSQWDTRIHTQTGPFLQPHDLKCWCRRWKWTTHMRYIILNEVCIYPWFIMRPECCFQRPAELLLIVYIHCINIWLSYKFLCIRVLARDLQAEIMSNIFFLHEIWWLEIDTSNCE